MRQRQGPGRPGRGRESVAGAARRARGGLAVVLRRYRGLDLGVHTLALSAQVVLCLAPLVFAVSALLRRYRAGSAGGLLADALGLSGDSAQDMRLLLEHTGHPPLARLVVGFLLAFAFCTGVAASAQRLLEVVWQRPRSPWQVGWVRVAWVLAVAPVIAVAITVGKLTSRLPIAGALDVATDAVVFGVLSALFSWLTQWALLLRAVPLRRLWPGSALTGLGAAVVSATSTQWIPGEIVGEVDDYGLVGATFVLSVWVFLLCGVFVAGVVAGRMLDERRHPGGEDSAD